MNLPQLYMRNPDITNLSPLCLPDGITLHTHVEGEEEKWEKLIESAFGQFFPFDILRKGDGYSPLKPEHVLYLAKDGKYIATATAVERDMFPNEGWFRLVGVNPDYRGIGAGKLIALAALHSLADRGYKSVVLGTEDERIPAINLYYSIGFRPIYTHESHKSRWESILKNMN